MPALKSFAKSALALPGRAARGAAALARRALSPAPDPDRLLIFDDAFPHLLSAFRVAEYNEVLRAFPAARVFSTGACFRSFKDRRSFAGVRREYEARYPEFRGRVSKFHPLLDFRGRLAYTIFLHNALFFLPVIEKFRLPFVFTLYPGYRLRVPETTAELRRVCGAPGFRRVIVTQPVTREYLLEERLCPEERITLVYGGVVPADVLAAASVPRLRLGRDKDTLDICFVGFKYVEGDLFKGYDVFVEAARRIARSFPAARFHVVGTFGPGDADSTELGDRIRFYGPQPTPFFPEFYARMDLILSPNDLPRCVPGAFNGFPTGCCAEAGLSGVAVFCTDPLGQNVGLKDGEDLVFINRRPEDIAGVVGRFATRYDDLCRLGERGREAFRRMFDLRAQMDPRLKVLARAMEED